MHVRPILPTIPPPAFGCMQPLPAKGPAQSVANEAPHRNGTLPRFGQYARPLLTQLRFGSQSASRVEYAVFLNRLDGGENNPEIQRQRQLYPDLVKLNEVRKQAAEAARQAGLDPFDVDFYVVPEDKLLELASQDGFPERYPHWSWGQEFFTKYKLPRLQGKTVFTEVVVPGQPVQAYLQDRDPDYAKKALMIHALARADLYKNNLYFKHLNPGLSQEVSSYASLIRHISQQLAQKLETLAPETPSAMVATNLGIDTAKIEAYRKGKASAEDVANETVEQFIEKVHSVRNLVDGLTPLKPLAQFREPTRSAPEYDVLGFVVKHSKVLHPWQRDIVDIIRRETHALSPRTRTQILADGWACFWNEKLNTRNPKMWDLSHFTQEARWSARKFRPDPVKVNSYQLGYEIFKGLEKDLQRKYADHPKRDRKVLEELLKIRKYSYDVSLIRQHLTKEMVENLLMYNYDPDKRGEAGQRQGAKLLISTHDFEKIRERLIEMYENGGQPVISVVNSSFDGNGELLLNHVYAYDLKKDYAEKTLINLAQLWGRRVYLETMETDDKKEPKPVRLTSDGRSVSKSSYDPQKEQAAEEAKKKVNNGGNNNDMGTGI